MNILRTRLIFVIFIVKLLSVVENQTIKDEEIEVIRQKNFITCGSTIRIRNSLSGYL